MRMRLSNARIRAVARRHRRLVDALVDIGVTSPAHAEELGVTRGVEREQDADNVSYADMEKEEQVEHAPLLATLGALELLQRFR